jgi:hypothetical protein
MSFLDNTHKKAVGSSYASPNGLLAGEKWKEKEKPQARPFCVTHGLSMGRSATLSPASCQRLPQKRAQYDLGRHETHERQVDTHESESTTLQ